MCLHLGGVVGGVDAWYPSTLRYVANVRVLVDSCCSCFNAKVAHLLVLLLVVTIMLGASSSMYVSGSNETTGALAGSAIHRIKRRQ
jgi:hypothetical protein